MYITLNGSTPQLLILVEERHSNFPFLMSWNNLSNTLHVFQIVMVTQLTLLIFSLLPVRRTILILSILPWGPLTTILSLCLAPLHRLCQSLLPNVVSGTLRILGGLSVALTSLIFLGMTLVFYLEILILQPLR